MAYDTILMDDKVDKLEQIERKLAEDFSNKVLDKQTLVNIMNLSSISYYLERIGDKAIDIAESKLFILSKVKIYATIK